MGLTRPYGKLNHSGIMQRVARIEARSTAFQRAEKRERVPKIRNMKLKVFKIKAVEVEELEKLRARGVEARKLAKQIGEEVNERINAILIQAGYDRFSEVKHSEISADGTYIVIHEYDISDKRPIKT